MKKLFLLFSIILLAGCKKDNINLHNTTIKYSFTSTGITSYVISYSNANGEFINVNFTGSTWTRTINTDSIVWKNANKVALFQLKNTQDVSPQIFGTISIYLNGEQVNFEKINVLSQNAIYLIGADLFKN